MQFKANNMKSPDDLKTKTHSKARTFSDVYSKNTLFKEMSQRADTEREESLRIEEQPKDSQPNFFKKMSNRETPEYDSRASRQSPSSHGEPSNAFGENESYSEHQYFPNSQNVKVSLEIPRNRRERDMVSEMSGQSSNKRSDLSGKYQQRQEAFISETRIRSIPESKRSQRQNDSEYSDIEVSHQSKNPFVQQASDFLVEEETSGSRVVSISSGDSPSKDDDITITAITDSQQLSSQMGQRPSIQFMIQTDDFDRSDTGGSPLLSKQNKFVVDSFKTMKCQEVNHKFSLSEDLSNMFQHLRAKTPLPRFQDQQVVSHGEFFRESESQSPNSKEVLTSEMQVLQISKPSLEVIEEKNNSHLAKGGSQKNVQTGKEIKPRLNHPDSSKCQSLKH